MRLAGGIVLDEEAVEVLADRVAERLAERAAPPEPWLGTEEAADYLAAPKSRIYDLVHRREVRFRKDGSRLLFRRADLDAALQEVASK